MLIDTPRNRRSCLEQVLRLKVRPLQESEIDAVCREAWALMRKACPGAPIAPVNAPSARMTQLPLPPLVERWNNLVDDALKVLAWDDQSPIEDLMICAGYPRFIESFDAIAAKCNAIYKNGHGVNSLTRLVWKDHKGKYLWSKMLDGIYDWAAQERKPYETKTRRRRTPAEDLLAQCEDGTIDIPTS